MTQLGAPLAARPAPLNDGFTNGREILAYAIAQTLKLVLIFALSFARIFAPLYIWAMQSGGRVALYAVSTGLSVMWGAFTLIVFFTSRSLLGGVPADTPRGPEIGLFALAYAVVIGVQLVLNAAILGQIYLALGSTLAPLVGLAVAIVFAAIVFAIFLAMRQAIRQGPVT